MTTGQKWLLIAAVWVFAVGTLLSSFQGRYKLPKLYDVYAAMHTTARYDTWTGELEVKHVKGDGWAWVKGATLWVEDLK
jgi:hypothetical protein